MYEQTFGVEPPAAPRWCGPDETLPGTFGSRTGVPDAVARLFGLL